MQEVVIGSTASITITGSLTIVVEVALNPSGSPDEMHA